MEAFREGALDVHPCSFKVILAPTRNGADYASWSVHNASREHNPGAMGTS
jgi:hypothetical protein